MQTYVGWHKLINLNGNKLCFSAHEKKFKPIQKKKKFMEKTIQVLINGKYLMLGEPYYFLLININFSYKIFSNL